MGTPGDRPVSEGGYPNGICERLAELEPGNYWFEARNELILWAIRRYFPEARTFLDVGCGTGFVLQAVGHALPGLSLAAVDRLDDGLAIARGRVPQARFFQQDIRTLAIDEQFDLVGVFDVLEHIPDDAAVLARLHQLVRPGGGLLVTVPQHPWLWSRVDERAHHVRRYRQRQLAGRLHDAGFTIERTTSFVSLPLPLMTLSRLFRRSETTGEADWRELAVPGMVNRVLRRVLDAERFLLRQGLSLPMGGSRLVAARRAADG